MEQPILRSQLLRQMFDFAYIDPVKHVLDYSGGTLKLIVETSNHHFVVVEVRSSLEQPYALYGVLMDADWQFKASALPTYDLQECLINLEQCAGIKNELSNLVILRGTDLEIHYNTVKTAANELRTHMGYTLEPIQDYYTKDDTGELVRFECKQTNALISALYILLYTKKGLLNYVAAERLEKAYPGVQVKAQGTLNDETSNIAVHTPKGTFYLKEGLNV